MLCWMDQSIWVLVVLPILTRPRVDVFLESHYGLSESTCSSPDSITTAYGDCHFKERSAGNFNNFRLSKQYGEDRMELLCKSRVVSRRTPSKDRPDMGWMVKLISVSAAPSTQGEENLQCPRP